PKMTTSASKQSATTTIVAVHDLTRKDRSYIIAAALLALFLGALDTLVMGAAMPTIVADMGGLELYSWVFSVYLLSRAIALPIFGKLADIYSGKHLFGTAIALFMIGSLVAGLATSMVQLIVARALQGVGAGAAFALVYILLADIAAPEKRGKMMSIASFVWGLASVLGPPMGGFIVNYWSWRWIFFINLPLGLLSFLGIYLYFKETRVKRRRAALDLLGGATLTVTVLSLLTVFLMTGNHHSWHSPPVIGLLALSLTAGVAFYFAEKRAADPILSIDFLDRPGFSSGNAAAFFSSFAIFSLSAFSPLFIQGALGRSPAEMGVAMIPLSLAWSGGALLCGQMAHRVNKRRFAVAGALLLMAGSALTLTFTTSMWLFSMALALAGIGMGFVSIASLLIVQESLSADHLGAATAAQQFARTLGGTIGVGVSGSLLNARFINALTTSGLGDRLPAGLAEQIRLHVEQIFRPDIQALIPPQALETLQETVGHGVSMVFWVSATASLVCLIFCLRLPRRTAPFRN
ncbi:MAG: MDR family MFS transporter, partial [Desulfobacterales bacterium]